MAVAPYVKICGVTSVADAAVVARAGASAIGLNFVPGSKRRIDVERGRAIAAQVRGRIEIVLVVADRPASELLALLEDVGGDFLQLHGTETQAELDSVLPRAFKAVPVGSQKDVEAARAFGGSRLLVDAKPDAKAEGEFGGAGVSFDWDLVVGLAAERPLILAGGLTPSNVEGAVRRVAPWGVDVASGVESIPGVKDPEKVRAFVTAARRARA